MKIINLSLRISPLLVLISSTDGFISGLSAAPPTVAPLAAAETVKAALPAGKVDEEMLSKAAKMSEGELRELMELYLKKKDQLMAVKMAHLLLALNDEDTAARAVLTNAGQPVAEASPDSAPESPLLAAARKLTAEGKKKEAVEAYEKVLAAQEPNVPFPYAMELASAYDDAELNAQALIAYDAVAKDATASPADRDEATRRAAELRRSSRLVAADQAMDAGKVAEAKAIIDQLSPEDQKSPEALIMEAKIMIGSGDLARGEAALQKMISDLTLTPEIRQEAKEVLADAKVNQLIKAGEGAFDEGQHRLALSLSEQVYAMAPERSDVIEFRAKTLLKNNEADAALQLLEKAPQTKDANGASDRSRLLAQAFEKTGSFDRAVKCYRDLGANSSLSLLDRDDALESADTLAAIGSARSSLDWRLIDAEEGRWNEVRVGFQSGVFSRSLQFIGEGYWDGISPSAGSRFSGKTEDDLLEASGALRAFFSGNRFLQAGVTGHRDGVGFGVSAGQFPLGGLGYQVRYDYQQRASYSQALRGLNGRQNKVSGTVQAELGGGVALDAGIGWRQVTVDHESIGSGFAGELSLLKTLLKETASTPGISIAYLGEISRFNDHYGVEVRRAIGVGPNEGRERMSELVDPRVNRQELQLSLVRHWSERFQTSASGAIGYEFEDAQSVWRLGFHMAYRLRPNLRLTLEGTYDSSGQGANSGSAMKSLWLGMAMDY